MFKTEQHINQKVRPQSKNAYLGVGTPLANGSVVKARFTYKELTLLIGIFVALIIAFAVWSNGFNAIAGETTGFAPDILSPALVNFIVKSVSIFLL